jgi:hypothetical protein
MIYKKALIIVVFLFILSGSLISQNKPEFSRNYKVLHYLLKDSSTAYFIKEIIYSDGTRRYSLIPKSFIEDPDIIKDHFPETLIEWFNKEKRSGKITGAEERNGIRRGIIDTSGVVQDKKNKTIWWILGTTAVIGGVTAYYFLQIKNAIEELPIQPDPPK